VGVRLRGSADLCRATLSAAVVVDEWTRERLSIAVAENPDLDDVLGRCSWLMATRRVPEHVRSDNGSEFTAKALRESLGNVRVKTLHIELRSLLRHPRPWGGGFHIRRLPLELWTRQRGKVTWCMPEGAGAARPACGSPPASAPVPARFRIDIHSRQRAAVRVRSACLAVTIG
jgi:hypothetical protein